MAQILTPHLTQLRVFERGVGETLACGSGAAAACIANYHFFNGSEQQEIIFQQGSIHVKYHPSTGVVNHTGPVAYSSV